MDLTAEEINYLTEILKNKQDKISIDLLEKLSLQFALLPEEKQTLDPQSQIQQLRINLSEKMRSMRKTQPESEEAQLMSLEAENIIARISELEDELRRGGN